ncbi:hydrolase [Leptospira perolatii]|uniref:Hydrolase n=1 Tax=Leptospira perolatii TaxID=2023191 RepID=A0A2M9ZSS4_9LEPT|nr:MBL fold metallo-hydrolase [Leptospira perolatii]PJZ68787.1 hydrolase [Leptospira perolatii]PJZ75142.1 hydrolase [Leptospira perolatii]
MRVHHYDSVPKIEEIGDGILKTEIPQPFYAPNNIYILPDGEPTLIDSGYIANLGMLQRALKQVGLNLKKIKHIIYTHNHLDHMSAMLTLRFYTDAKLYAMKGMAADIGNYLENIQVFNRATKRLVYKGHRSAEDRKRELTRIEEGNLNLINTVKGSHKVEPNVRFDIELVEGDVIHAGGREIGFLHTPGHNLWHLTPYLLGEEIFFTGDLVLQNISSIYAEIDGNLDDYHRSLDRLSKISIRRLLPAHGSEPEDPQKAIKLLSKTLQILERGVMRRLKERDQDLSNLVLEAMGEKVANSGYYNTAMAILHSFVRKFIDKGWVEVIETEPPYETYRWIGEK